VNFNLHKPRSAQRVTAAVYSGRGLKQASLQIRVAGRIESVHVLEFANKKESSRFCVGDPSSHSSVWGAFANRTKSDVYVAIRSSASLHKISLYESGDYRHQLIEMTRETLQRPDLSFHDVLEGNGSGRILHQWKRQPPVQAGWVDCMGISVPTKDLLAGAGHFQNVI
jgi:hypothetical protein